MRSILGPRSALISISSIVRSIGAYIYRPSNAYRVFVTADSSVNLRVPLLLRTRTYIYNLSQKHRDSICLV